MTYDKIAKNLIERFLRVTQNYEKARNCAILYCDLNIEDLKSKDFVNSWEKLRIHELHKIKSHL